jgi:hypothetical protein
MKIFKKSKKRDEKAKKSKKLDEETRKLCEALDTWLMATYNVDKYVEKYGNRKESLEDQFPKPRDLTKFDEKRPR